MGFSKWLPVSGQTYTRKIDYMVLCALSGLAQSAYKMCGDIRLLASMKEIEEPFGKNQIGSSAMAYKRNPMRSERVCSLARYLMSLPENAAHTHANQWFERTLDDSAIRRIILPEGFLSADVILNTLINIMDGLQVWPAVIGAHVAAELPFMATEVILMQGVKLGGDRQELHEAIREHSMAAGRVVKEQGKKNDLLDRIAKDPLFANIHGMLKDLVDPMQFIGRSPEQVVEFMEETVNPLLNNFASEIGNTKVDNVNV
jgi:adenylosuccinate lyase